MRLVRIPAPGQFISVTPDTTMPRYSAETYPESTDVLCWHCCHSFSGPPIPLPLSYDTSRDVFRVYGVFCSTRCMAGYSRDNRAILPGASNGSIGMAVFQFITRWTGHTDPKRIHRAPPRCLLKAFGGYMTLDEFRGGGDCDIVPMPPRCILQEQVFHERQQSKSHIRVGPVWTSRAPLSAPGAASSAGETLKLKRKHQRTNEAPKVKRTILEQALGMC